MTVISTLSSSLQLSQKVKVLKGMIYLIVISGSYYIHKIFSMYNYILELEITYVNLIFIEKSV